MKHYYIIVAIVGCSAFPAPHPQFPLFGNPANNTSPANGSQSPTNGFFAGLGGLVNNMMSSIWNFLPIPGKQNINPQPQQLPGGIIALPDNFPPPPGMIQLPVTNGAGGFPSLLPPGASSDGNALLQLLQQQQQQQAQQNAFSMQPNMQAFSQMQPNMQMVSQSPIQSQQSGLTTIQMMPQQQAPAGYQVITQQPQMQSSNPLTTFQLVGQQSAPIQATNSPVTYQVVSQPQHTMGQTTLLLPPPRRK